MTWSAWLWGSLLLVGLLMPAFLAAGAQRRRWLPGWHGAVAWLADLVVAWTIVIMTAQLLGAVGWFRVVPLMVATGLVSTGLLAAGERDTRVARLTPVDEHRSGAVAPTQWALVAAIAVAAAEWASRTAESLRSGITAADSLWYHLPRAARFAQTGWVTRLHQTAPEFPDAFHPSTGELVHALPMLMYQRDAVSPLVNLGWVAMLVLAAWCVGRPSGRAELAALGVVALLASPLVVVEGAGNAGNDIAAMAFLVAALAFVLQPGGTAAQLGLAGLAAGLAISTKLTVVPAVAMLTLGVVWAGRPGERLRRTLAWTIGLLVTGTFWYVRNLFAVGSPVPSTDLPFFGHRSFRIADELGFSVADYLTDERVWREWFLPGLRADFGWAWPVLAVAAVWTVIAALLERGDRFVQSLALLLPVSTIAYVTLPTTALGERGEPILFAGNVIYLVPVLMIAVAALPTMRAARSGPSTAVLVLGAVFVIVAGALTSPIDTVVSGRSAVAAGTFGIAGIAGTAVLLAGRTIWHNRTALAVLGVAVLVIGLVAGRSVVDRYIDGRYPDSPVYRWAATETGAKVAIAGFAGQFPLYGPHLDNTVAYLGDARPNGEFHDLRSCRCWRDALRDGRYDYVVLRSERSDVTDRQLEWTRSDPAAVPLLERDGTYVFRLDRTLSDAGCP